MGSWDAPEGITLRLLGPDDADLLCGVEPGLLDHPVRRDEAAAFLADPSNLIVVAFDGARDAGFASGTVLRHPDKAPSLFVNEVGVRDGWLRRGIGRALTGRLIAEARMRGLEGVWLATETDNAPALAMYRSMDGDERAIVGFGWDGAFEV